MGLATLFSGNCRISNPILFCNPESPESLETTGVAGRCDPEVGCIAPLPPFSCYTLDSPSKMNNHAKLANEL